MEKEKKQAVKSSKALALLTKSMEELNDQYWAIKELSEKEAGIDELTAATAKFCTSIVRLLAKINARSILGKVVKTGEIDIDGANRLWSKLLEHETAKAILADIGGDK